MDKEQLGYLTARVEDLARDQEALREKFDKLEILIAKKFATAETLFNVFKFIGLAAIAVLTFKFGDISKLWNTFF